MKQKITIRFLLTGIMLAAVTIAMGQPPRGPLANSPQVLPDKKVTFRYVAPLAKEVKLSGQFMTGQLPMVKDANGMWSVTVGPVRPDIYPYSFNVDGVT